MHQTFFLDFQVRACGITETHITLLKAITPLFGNGAGAHGIGKISHVLTKIEKFDIIIMYDVSIARLIPIIKLT